MGFLKTIPKARVHNIRSQSNITSRLQHGLSLSLELKA
jgi:hypothetical protein